MENLINTSELELKELQKSHAELLEALNEAIGLVQNLIDSDIIAKESIRSNDFIIQSNQAIKNATK
mgnify:CR=1 FL=1